jgi:Glycosyl transferase family 2
VTARRAPAPDLLPVRLRAVMCTWHEADIVAVTVRNALEQGCDAVHLIDNASGDATVERAVAAGATLEHVFATETFEHRQRRALTSEVIERVSTATGAEHVWWLHLDADELVEGPAGQTVREVLERLDRSFRVVGSRTVNHYPSRAAPLAIGMDPRAVATNAQERVGTACRLGHWKHPLLRWDAHGPPLRAAAGYHVVLADERLVEPLDHDIVSHHYPYRNRSATAERLELLEPRLAGDTWAMGRRGANVDAVYREAYDEVDPFDMVGPAQRFDPRPHPPVRPPVDG